MIISVPNANNEKLANVIERINSNAKLMTYLKSSNVMAINRLMYTDHGPVHVKIVANIALRLFRILKKKNVQSSLVRDFPDYNFTDEDAEVVIVLASVLHDIGMIIHRVKHDETGLILAKPLIEELLDGIYSEEQIAVMTGEVLHAILMHDSEARPLTIEAGIVRIADGLDMERGRARIPYEKGKINIHSVSAMAIEKVEIAEGKEKPIEITIKMTNPAGIFQVDELLKHKIEISGLEKYIKVKVDITGKSEIDKYTIG